MMSILKNDAYSDMISNFLNRDPKRTWMVDSKYGKTRTKSQWDQIADAAESDPVLKEMLDKVLVYYTMKKI